jgi:uncharacterized membrane protein
METPATIKHHPLHPLMITLPIGMFTLSVICDVIYLASNQRILFHDFATYAIIAGIICALLAAIPGVIDWFSLKGEKVRKTANYHAILNICVLILFGISLAWRLNDPSATNAVGQFILSLIAIAVLCVGGWLGGTLVHEYRVAVEEPGTQPTV